MEKLVEDERRMFCIDFLFDNVNNKQTGRMNKGNINLITEIKK